MRDIFNLSPIVGLEIQQIGLFSVTSEVGNFAKNYDRFLLQMIYQIVYKSTFYPKNSRKFLVKNSKLYLISSSQFDQYVSIGVIPSYTGCFLCVHIQIFSKTLIFTHFQNLLDKCYFQKMCVKKTINGAVKWYFTKQKREF